MVRGNKNQLVIISVVAVMVIVLLAFNNQINLQGAAVSHIRHVETFEAQCVDDDPQNNYDQPGIVQQRSTLYLDYCRGNTLVQRSCETGGKIGIADYRCPDGCLNGACL